eukprot:670476-Pelagomonas_calceolata.AAC.1
MLCVWQHSGLALTGSLSSQRKLSLHHLRNRDIGSKEPQVPFTTKQEQKGQVGIWWVSGTSLNHRPPEPGCDEYSVFNCAPNDN